MSTTTTTPDRLRLYEIPAAFAAIDAAIDDLDGELPCDIEAQLDALEATLEDRADAVAALVRQAQAEVKFFDSEMDRLAVRQKTAAARGERLKAYLHRTLVVLGRDKVETARFKLRIQRNSAASIRWTGDDDSIPEGFRRVLVTMDGRAAQAAHKAGTLPEGFEVTTSTHLRIS